MKNSENINKITNIMLIHMYMNMCVYICKGIYYKNLSRVIMEAGKLETCGADDTVQVPRLADWKS